MRKTGEQWTLTWKENAFQGTGKKRAVDDERGRRGDV